MIAFIDDHREAHGRSAGNALPARRVEPICEVLPIAPSSYRAHAAARRDPTKSSARARRDAVLREKSGASSTRTSWFTVRARSGGSCSEKERRRRAEHSRLMRAMGLQGVVRGKSVLAR